MATLALFLALGGVGYAAATIDGSDVINGSLTGADVRNSSLDSADMERNSLNGGDISEGSLGTVPNADEVNGQDVDSNRLQLAIGERAVLMRKAPFRIIVECREEGGLPSTNAFVRSEQPDTLWSSTLGGNNYDLDPGEAHTFSYLGQPETEGRSYFGPVPFVLEAPNGPGVSGQVSVGTRIFGADCLAQVLSIG